MRTALILAIALLSMAMAAAGCTPDNGDHQVPPRAERGDDPISVQGCLTAGPEQQKFVLTAASTPMTTTTARVAGQTQPTFTYELVGGQNLDQHAGQQVTVRGRLDDEKDDAEFEQQREAVVDKTTPRGDTPTVTSTEQVEVEVRRIFVEAVEGTGQPCVAE
jgi:hypothetical protein